jgi:hypothetical protein
MTASPLSLARTLAGTVGIASAAVAEASTAAATRPALTKRFILESPPPRNAAMSTSFLARLLFQSVPDSREDRLTMEPVTGAILFPESGFAAGTFPAQNRFFAGTNRIIGSVMEEFPNEEFTVEFGCGSGAGVRSWSGAGTGHQG